MLRIYMKYADRQDQENLRTLSDALQAYPYLKQAYEAGLRYLK